MILMNIWLKLITQKKFPEMFALRHKWNVLRRMLVCSAWLGVVMVSTGSVHAREGMRVAYPEFQPFFSATEAGNVQGFF